MLDGKKSLLPKSNVVGRRKNEASREKRTDLDYRRLRRIYVSA